MSVAVLPLKRSVVETWYWVLISGGAKRDFLREPGKLRVSTFILDKGLQCPEVWGG
jgi:hypothetical protein